MAPTCPAGYTLQGATCYAPCPSSHPVLQAPFCVKTASCGASFTPAEDGSGCVPNATTTRTSTALTDPSNINSCPANYVYDSGTNLCYSACTSPNTVYLSLTTCMPPCPASTFLNGDAGTCDFTYTATSVSDAACASGFVASTDGTACCPSGYSFSTDNATCIAPVQGGGGGGGGTGTGTGTGTGAAAADDDFLPAWYWWVVVLVVIVLLVTLGIALTAFSRAQHAEKYAGAVEQCADSGAHPLAACVTDKMRAPSAAAAAAAGAPSTPNGMALPPPPQAPPLSARPLPFPRPA